MLKNGRPYTDNKGVIDDALITSHPKEEIDLVCRWIKANFEERQTPNYDKSSYGLKHILQRDTGIYLTNNEFKDAMLMCGFEPVDSEQLNWYYRISRKSLAFYDENRVKLRPCPCCNSRKVFVKGTMVQCSNCGLRTQGAPNCLTRKEAVEQWNQRIPITKLIAVLEDFKNEHKREYNSKFIQSCLQIVKNLCLF